MEAARQRGDAEPKARPQDGECRCLLGSGSRKTFIGIHVDHLAAMDFFMMPV